MVIGSKMSRDLSRVRRLVDRRVLKPDRISLEAARDQFVCMCSNKAGIDSTAEKTSQWDIGDQPARNGIAKWLLQIKRARLQIDRFVASGWSFWKCPIRIDGEPPAVPHSKVPGRQLVYLV